MRDRLIELLQNLALSDELCVDELFEWADTIADHLIANGVIVPPCEVGTVVYRVCKQKYPVDSYRMHWEEDWVILTRPFDLSMIPEIGKTVFLNRKEAEQAIKEKE